MNWMERLNERAGLMGRMLETIGAMQAMPAGPHMDAALRTAAQRCMNCRETEACRRWLDEHPQGSGSVLEACPNANLFRHWFDN